MRTLRTLLRQNDESGQAIVILAVTLVVLCGYPRWSSTWARPTS